MGEQSSSAHDNPYRTPWYEEHSPSPVTATPEFILHDPDLSVPPELLETTHQPNPLLEMLPALEAEFGSYYQSQVERIESWGGLVVGDKAKLTPQEKAYVSYLGKRKPLLDKHDKQAAFVSELVYAKTFVERILDMHAKDSLASIVVLHDLDDSLGLVPEPPDGDEFLGQNGEDDVNAFIIRPAYKVVVDYLYAQKGIQVTQGILSTKSQRWLGEFYSRLEALCPNSPGAFKKDALISSRDGRFAAAMSQENKILRQEGATLGDVFSSDIFPGYGTLHQAMDLSSDVLERDLAHYDLKPLIGVRLQHEPDYATSTILLVDDWGLMSIYNNMHSDQQAIELRRGGATFAPPDVAWDRALLEAVRFVKEAQTSQELADGLSYVRHRFAPPGSQWAHRLRGREVAARRTGNVVRYANV